MMPEYIIGNEILRAGEADILKLKYLSIKANFNVIEECN